MDVEADVAAVDADGLAGVDADAHPNRAVARVADRTRRAKGGVGIRETGRELVAAAVDLLATGVRERGPHRVPVLLQGGGVRIAELLQEPGRSLDVGEEEGDAH